MGKKGKNPVMHNGASNGLSGRGRETLEAGKVGCAKDNASLRDEGTGHQAELGGLGRGGCSTQAVERGPDGGYQVRVLEEFNGTRGGGGTRDERAGVQARLEPSLGGQGERTGVTS